ncbi:LOW QUALITY PROTEIN: hypothetical protein TorRG33x02_181880 [Trema orientale]|uniref:Uncharacterized protein n=1 Tax=Trema orientale TaxID=63057 RepID=A0A2P5EKC0_TREOI|nr:LOW QUALITY PROTEIN: hypothetical protein TorRG33x02_181880 [Trema orientale]
MGLLMSFKSRPIGLASLHCNAHIMVRNFEHFGNSNSPFRSYSTSLPYPSKSSAPEASLDGMAGSFLLVFSLLHTWTIRYEIISCPA